MRGTGKEVTKVTSVDGKLSEGSKVSSVRSLACGQATAPRERRRWLAVIYPCVLPVVFEDRQKINLSERQSPQMP